MVATVTALGAAQSTVHYFERDGYYARNDPEHRRASFWHGRAAEALRLRGHVRPRRFEEVLAGFVPHTGIRLGRKRDGAHQHRPGLDLTLSAPKSVSLEALVFGERRVVRAHDAAVRETLDWVEAELLRTRGYDPATGRRPRVRADGMVAAGFRHLTSRNQDPQLHTHCVIANMTRNEDRAWRSLETTRVHRGEKLIGAYYRNALARRLQALGYAVAPTRIGRVPGFEIAGYERALLDAFSGRRREILTWLEAHGLAYTPALTRTAALATRGRKEDIGLGVLIPRWRARAHALGLGRSAALARPPRPLDPETGRRSARVRVPAPALPANVIRNRARVPALPDLRPDQALEALAPAPTRRSAPATLLRAPERGVLEAVARAVAAIEERSAVFAETEVRALALGAAPGRYTLTEVDAAIAALVRDGELVEAARRGAEPAFVTHRAIWAERRVLERMRAGRGAGIAFVGERSLATHLERTRLTGGQRRALEAMARSADWLIGVQGHAGSGKTTMLRTAAALPGMPRVHGLAPSAGAARTLHSAAGIETRTLQWFLARFGDLSDPRRVAWGTETYAGTVLVVDEASMVGTAQMAALLRIARTLEVARVVLVGDTRQLRAVDAGQPFRVLQKAGMATAVMDEVLRQRDATLAAAVAHVREGRPDLALRTLGARVRETDRETLGEAAGATWLALPDQARAETLVLAPTHALRRAIHATIREGLALEGTLHGANLTVERLIDRRLTRAETADIRSYAEDDTVVFHRDAYGCRRDDHCTVSRIGEGFIELAHPDGAARRFRPSGNVSRNLGVFDTETIEIRAGDRIRWTRNRRAPRAAFGHPRAPALVNGDTAQVLSIDARRVRLRTEHGEPLALRRSDPQLRHLDHAYSATVHAAQGATVRSVIAALPSAGLTDQTLLYVEMSRAAEDFVLLTDDREALAEVLVQRPGLEHGALEAIGEALTAPPVVEPEVFERLRTDWGAVQERARAAGELAYLTEGYADVMARAAALCAIEDLPADMRRFAATLLGEHTAHRRRDRAVRDLIGGLQAHARRWAELGWANGHASPEETPGYRQWRTRATGMLDTARAWRTGESALARHLEATPGARAGLASAVRAVERLRVRDDGWRFERQWRAVQARAAGDGMALIDVEGYGTLAALGEALAADAEGLDRASRRALDAWRRAHDRATAERARIERYPREVAAHIEARYVLDLPRDADGGLDPGHAGYRRWREQADGLLERGRTLLEQEPPAEHELRRQAERASAALADLLHADEGRALAWRYRDLLARAESAGTLAFYTPGHDALIARARALQKGPRPLAPAPRAVVDAMREHDETCRRRRAEIARFPEAVRACIAARAASGPLPMDAEVLLHDGGAMLADPRISGPHLDALPGARTRIAAALASLRRALDAERQRPSSGEAYVVPCREHAVAGDRLRWTMPADAGWQWGIEDEPPRLDCVVVGVEPGERPAEALVELRVEAREGPRGPEPGERLWTDMATLARQRCLRAAWADEDERARIEARARREALAHARRLERRRRRDRGQDRSMGW